MIEIISLLLLVIPARRPPHLSARDESILISDLVISGQCFIISFDSIDWVGGGDGGVPGAS